MNDRKTDFLLLKKRIVYINDTIEDESATLLISKLLYLNEPPYEDVFLFINSPGGSVSPAFAVYDTMRFCKFRIATVCMYQTASLATLLLAAGTKGMRYAFDDSVIKPALYPSVGVNGVLYSEKASVVNSVFEKVLNIYAILTNNCIEMMRTVCMTDHTLEAVEAQNYGYIDNIIHLGPLQGMESLDYVGIVDIIQKLTAHE